MDTRKKSFIFSLVLHIVVLFFVIASFDFTGKMPVLTNSNEKMAVIQATVMNVTPTPRKMIPEPEKIIPKVASVEPQKTQPVIQPKKKAIAISDKKQKKLEQDKIAKQLLADIVKQRDQHKKLKQKALANAFEKDIKQLKAKSIQKQMQEEVKTLTTARTQQTQGEVNKYKALILQIISQNWIIPGVADKKLSAQLLIRVAPGGMVLDVQVVKSSGDEGLDRSARAAVFKSSPLPVPKDAEAFQEFKQFVLKVRPENVLRAEAG